MLSVLVGGALGLAQQPASPGDAVVVDFLATTNDGKPITDLKAEDVTLRVDGRQRTLRSLQLVEHGASATGATTAGDPPPMPFAVNDAPDRSRAILFAIEDASINTNSGRVVRDTIVKFLEGMSSGDRIGLVTVPQATLRADLAPGGAKAREVSQQITGRAPASASTAESTCRTRDTLEALRNLLSSLAGGIGIRF